MDDFLCCSNSCIARDEADSTLKSKYRHYMYENFKEINHTSESTLPDWDMFHSSTISYFIFQQYVIKRQHSVQILQQWFNFVTYHPNNTLSKDEVVHLLNHPRHPTSRCTQRTVRPLKDNQLAPPLRDMYMFAKIYYGSDVGELV